MSHNRNSVETKDYDLSKLSILVKENNIEGIKTVISQAKTAKGWQWHWSDNRYVECATRDAILLGQLETVKLILKEGIDASTYAYSKGHTGCLSTLISFAAESGNLAIVKLLVEENAEIKPRDSYYNRGDDSAINAAVKGGHVDIAKYLLEKGATADGVINYGMRRLTFLAEAALQGNIELLELLIQYGAPIENSIALAEEKFKEDIRYYPSKKVELKSSYHKVVKTIMDYATGVDFSKEAYSNWSFRDFRGLTFLKDMDVADFNFLGMSVAGQPITKEMLLEKKLTNADKSIVTLSDLKEVEKKRRDALNARLEKNIQKQGQLIHSNGVVNLVPLWRAAEVGDEKAVAARLKAGIDPNEASDEKIIPIVVAAEKGHSDIVKMFLNHPKLNTQTLVQAIRAAQNAGHTAVVNLLISKQDINQKDEKGDTRLHHAVQAGEVDEVKKLIQNGADVNMQGSRGYPLYMAASKSYDNKYFGEASPSHVEIVKILLECKADPNVAYYNNLPLEAAASCGSFEAVKLLLPCTKKTQRIEVVGFDDEKVSCPWYLKMMFESYQSGEWLDILKLLKSEGADFNLIDIHGKNTLLHRVMRDFSSFSDISSSMRDVALSMKGYEAKMPSDTLQKTQDYLIDRSIQRFKKHLGILDFLLENGSDPSIVEDRNGNTPLHEFMENVSLSHFEEGYKEIFDRCLKKEFKINTPNNYGKTLLHIAASRGDITAVNYLLSKGADVNARDNDNCTPVYYAAAGNPETTKCLIAAGADITIRDKEGLTPLDYSRMVCEQSQKRYSFTTSQARNDFVKPYSQAQDVLASAALKRVTTQRSGIFSAAPGGPEFDVVTVTPPGGLSFTKMI